MNMIVVRSRAFLLKCLVWLQLWQSRHYTEWIPDFGEKTYYTLNDKGYHQNQSGVVQKLYIL